MEENQMAVRILDSFRQFKRLHLKQSPVEGLTQGEVMLLIRIGKLGDAKEQGIKVSDLSSSLRIAPPSVTQLINTLEAGGYVKRSMDASDRRAVRVKLTLKGTEAFEKAVRIFNQTINGLIEYLGEEKCNTLLELMSEVRKYFEMLETSNTDSDTDGR